MTVLGNAITERRRGAGCICIDALLALTAGACSSDEATQRMNGWGMPGGAADGGGAVLTPTASSNAVDNPNGLAPVQPSSPVMPAETGMRSCKSEVVDDKF